MQRFMVFMLLVFGTGAAWGSTECQTTFVPKVSSGVQFCVTENGNILNLQGPIGTNQIGLGEGYAICDVHGNFAYWDLGGNGDSGNWGPSAITDQPNGPGTFPYTITRTTADGVVTLSQKFRVISAGEAISVTMYIGGLYAILRRIAEVVPQPNQVGNNTQATAFVWTPSGNGLIAIPATGVQVQSQIAQGGVQNACTLDGSNGNKEMVLSWILLNKRKTVAYFQYAPIR